MVIPLARRPTAAGGYFFGFPIGRQFVESNCGRDEPGVGTTFTIDLPGG